MRVERTFGADMYEQDAHSAAWANMDVPNVLSIPWAVTRPFHFPSGIIPNIHLKYLTSRPVCSKIHTGLFVSKIQITEERQ